MTDLSPLSDAAGPEPTPSPIKRRFNKREAATAGAWLTVGAIGATVLTGVAFAAADPTTPPSTAPSTESPSAGTPPTDAPGEGKGQGQGRGPGGHRGGHGGPGGIGLGLGMGKVLHGDVTVANKDGAVTVVRTQRGEVTSVSGTSVTVKSTDDYTATWTTNDDTKINRDGDEKAVADLKVGDTVMLFGPLSGDTATATRIHALSPEAAAAAEEKRKARRAEREERQQNKSDSDSSDTQGSNSNSSASSSA